MRQKRSNAALLALALAVLLLGACATAGNREYRAGERDYDAGNYLAAAENAVKALQINDEHEEAPSLLRRALPRATEQLETEIGRLEASSEEFAYEKIVPLYEALLKLHGDVAALRLGLPTEDYDGQLQEARQAAAEGRYQAGRAALAAGGFENARVALAHFRTVNSYAADYKDTAALIGQAEDASLARLYVYANDEQGVVAERLTQNLMADDGVVQVTDFLEPGALGVGPGRDVASVLSAAAAQGVDLLLFVEVGPVSLDQQGLQETAKQLLGGSQGFEVTGHYSVGTSGRWQIYDVANRSVRQEDTFQVSLGDRLRFQYVPSTGGTGSVFFDDVGYRDVAYAEVPSFNLITDTMRLSRSVDFVKAGSTRPDMLRTMSLSDLTSDLEDVTLFKGVYALNTEEDRYVPVTMDSPTTYAKVHEFVEKSNAIIRSIETNFEQNMADRVSAAQNALPNQVEASVRSAVVSPLMQ